MQFTATDIPGAFIVDPVRHADARGYFARTYCAESFETAGIDFVTVQCNTSFNAAAGTLRGMHYQADPVPEAKLVRCTRGRVFDVAVDLRPESPGFRRWISVELSADNLRALFVPTGCAHGFMTLEKDSELFYQMGAPYVADLARGVRWNDPAFGIAWPGNPSVIAERDAAWPDFTA